MEILERRFKPGQAFTTGDTPELCNLVGQARIAGLMSTLVTEGRVRRLKKQGGKYTYTLVDTQNASEEENIRPIVEILCRVTEEPFTMTTIYRLLEVKRAAGGTLTETMVKDLLNAWESQPE
jgi:hypothetical protein